MSEILRAAVVQMGSTSDKEANLDRCEAFVRQAAENGCKLIVLPENFPFIGGLKRKVEMAEPVSNDQPGPIVGRFKKLAAELDAHLILGGIPTLAEAGRCHNTSILLNNEGNIAAHYHKVHLFDIAIAGSVTFAESEFVVPGKESILANAAGRKVGLTICYDLRFPELYRDLTKKGLRDRHRSRCVHDAHRQRPLAAAVKSTSN
jgi:predicted amidohydrolase